MQDTLGTMRDEEQEGKSCWVRPEVVKEQQKLRCELKMFSLHQHSTQQGNLVVPTATFVSTRGPLGASIQFCMYTRDADLIAMNAVFLPEGNCKYLNMLRNRIFDLV